MKYPFDERNRCDYNALSVKLQESLERISSERTPDGVIMHEPTAKTLAKLAGCSLATIYARQGQEPLDPVLKLRQIQSQRNLQPTQPSRNSKPNRYVSKQHLQSASTHIQEKALLQNQLVSALDEATRWNKKWMDESQKKRGVDEQNLRLVQKVAALEEQIKKLTMQTGKVLGSAVTVLKRVPIAKKRHLGN